MYSHKLSASDGWFIKKGMVDSLSRTPFEVGHEVVVCDKKHVTLREYHDGECPTCRSRVTVPFSRTNVEPDRLRSRIVKCPRCRKEVSTLFGQNGTGKCPKCKKSLSVNSRPAVVQANYSMFEKGQFLFVLLMCVLTFISVILSWARMSTVARSM